MSFNPIQPENIALQPHMIQQNHYRMIQGGSALDKPTFWQNFSMGLAKFGSVFGRIAGSVLRFFPGLGTVASAGLYGISDFAQYSYEKMVNKQFNNLAMDEAAAQANFQMLTPGFGMFSGPGGAATPDVNDGFQEMKLGTVLNREMAARSEIAGLSPTS